MMEISLSNSFIPAQVDDEDFERVNLHCWSFNHLAGITAKINSKTVKLHRFVLNETNSEILIDHKDTNKKNNQKSNLRRCSYAQNNCNRLKRHHILGEQTSSQFKGVTWVAKKKRWRAYIYFKRKYYSLGHFKSEIDAAISYNTRAIILHGDFAYLNVIPKSE